MKVLESDVYIATTVSLHNFFFPICFEGFFDYCMPFLLKDVYKYLLRFINRLLIHIILES